MFQSARNDFNGRNNFIYCDCLTIESIESLKDRCYGKQINVNIVHIGFTVKVIHSEVTDVTKLLLVIMTLLISQLFSL